jgi:hypothetical protein
VPGPGLTESQTSERLPPRGEADPTRLLVVAMVLAAGFLLWETRGQTMLFDEWSFFADYRGHSPSILLNPFGDNLEIVPILIYKTVFALFGPASIALRLITVALNLTCAGLFYVLMRRRVGGWIAFAAASLLMVLGAAADVVGASLGIAIMTAVACGLGALIALERGDQRGDRIACLLLIGALASNSIGLPFAVGAAVLVVFSGPRPRAGRWWVAGAPLLLYGIWRLWSLHLDPLGPLAAHPTDITLANIGTLPTSIADSLADAVLSITGLYTQPGIAARTFSTDFGPPLAVAVVAALVLRIRRGPALDRRVLAYAAMPLAYWAAIALVASDRTPSVSRYQYGGAILLLLLSAELARDVRIAPRLQAAIVAALLISAAPNAYNIHASSELLRQNARMDRAEMAAIEIAGDRVPYDLLVEPIGGRFDRSTPALFSGGQLTPLSDALIAAGRYRSAVAAFGSPAYSESELDASPAEARAAADAELAAALGPHLVPVSGPLRDCHRRTSAGPGTIELPVPPGGVAIRVAAGGTATLSLRRFGDSYSIPAGTVAGGSALELRLPADGSSRAWGAQLAYSGRVEVCAP